MKKYDWIPVVEEQPPQRRVVIVCQTAANDAYRIFAGWLDGGVWYEHRPETLATEATGHMRATDFWLTLPEWDAGSGAVRVMEYPA